MRFNALIPELGVRDLGASLEFYVGLIGFRVAYDRPEEGFAFLECGQAQLMLDTIGLGRSGDDASGRLGGGINFQLEVDDLDAIMRRLEDAGWPIALGPETRCYRTPEGDRCQRQIWVRDPDGYLLRPFQAI
ncbi:VOC family protein [Martelella limonii]|uniref:VOC family protein n=1 Tax=Martelella limonii TaxID=1647649 RepID=UPI0015812E17